MVMGPGQRPDEVLEYAALSLANIEGESHTYSWEHKTPPHRSSESAPCQYSNRETPNRSIIPSQPCGRRMIPRLTFIRARFGVTVCVFPWWNHWPVAPRPTDGRLCHV